MVRNSERWIIDFVCFSRMNSFSTMVIQPKNIKLLLKMVTFLRRFVAIHRSHLKIKRKSSFYCMEFCAHPMILWWIHRINRWVSPKYRISLSTAFWTSHRTSESWEIVGWSLDFDLHLAYVMADAGYDVFLVNNRGNFYSRNHLNKNPNDRNSGFWDFSWDDIGLLDYPATFEYIRQMTGQSKLYVVAHSQGTSALMALLSEKPEFNDQINAVSLMAPVSYLTHAEFFYRMLSKFERPLQVPSDFFQLAKIFTRNCSNCRWFAIGKYLHDQPVILNLARFAPVSVCPCAIGWWVNCLAQNQSNETK